MESTTERAWFWLDVQRDHAAVCRGCGPADDEGGRWESTWSDNVDGPVCCSRCGKEVA